MGLLGSSRLYLLPTNIFCFVLFSFVRINGLFLLNWAFGWGVFTAVVFCFCRFVLLRHKRIARIPAGE